MGHQIIKQPNGLFAVWSTIVDDFVMVDATPEEIIEEEIKARSDNVEKEIRKIVKSWNENGCYQHFMDWEEANEWRKTVHGKDVVVIELLRIDTTREELQDE